MVIGLLALQGCIAPHERSFARLNIPTIQVKQKADFQNIDALVLPGGESSTMIKLLDMFQIWDFIQDWSQNHSIWGVCAGSILMSDRVCEQNQKSLQLMDFEIIRNGYGRQLESFDATLDLDKNEKFIGTFIRAPKISRYNPKLKVLAQHESEAVALASSRHMTTTFHPELGEDDYFHSYFVELSKKNL